tara:strand:- start:578 stop:745 length:168 start_codon:yes stop_codon:yes gene_type:complete
MGFIQKLATRNPRVYENAIKKAPKRIVKDNVLYEIVVTKKDYKYYLNPVNWFKWL